MMSEHFNEEQIAQIKKDFFEYGFPFKGIDTQYRIKLNRGEPITDVSYIKKKILEYLEKGIRDSIQEEKRVGLFLSSGVDSTSLAIMLGNKFKDVEVYVYTAFFGNNKGEVESSKKLCNKYGFKLNVIKVKEDEETWINVIKAIGRPISDAASIPVWKMCEQAQKDGIKVIITGDGADEIELGGSYDHLYKLKKHKDWYIPYFPFAGRFLQWTNLPKIKVFGEGMQYKTWQDWLLARYYWNLEIAIPWKWSEQRCGIIKHFGIKPCFPFLSQEFLDMAINIPIDLKYSKPTKWLCKEAIAELDPIILKKKKRTMGFPHEYGTKEIWRIYEDFVLNRQDQPGSD
jgi:asparagine synthetase B (glutamine-hydrolysing)